MDDQMDKQMDSWLKNGKMGGFLVAKIIMDGWMEIW